MTEETPLNTIELATELTIAWLGNQNVRVSADDVPAFLRTMHSTISELSNPPKEALPEDSESMEIPDVTPAVSDRKSLASREHILSMIDGKPYKTLRRHLTRHGLTPEQYRERYKLKPDYPMVSQSYSETRRALAKKIGLGAKPRAAATPVVAEPAPKKRAPRRPKSEA